ncbi:hypothetical protein Tco_0465601 [Tanacetum coccineum]
MASFNQRHCFHCKDPLEEHERCQRCTCKRCWSGLSKGFCHICNEYSSIDDSNPNSFIDSPKVFNPPPQPLTHSIESLNANPNFDNTPQEQSSHYQDPSENFAQNFSQCPPQINQNFCYGCGDSLDDFFCQRCTCEFCGNGAHYGYDCPPQDYRSGRIDIEIKINELKENINGMKEYTIAITPEKPVDSLIMEDDHLDTIPETESDEFIKSSVKNLVPTPSESEDFSDIKSECDYSFATQEYLKKFSSAITPDLPKSDSLIMEDKHLDTIPEPESDELINVCDDSSPKKDEVLDDIISIPPGNGNDHFNAESSLIESVLNRDNVISSPKIDFLLEEFAGELALIAPIPPGIVEADFDPKGDIRFIENLMYDNSFPRPPETLKDDSETVIDSNNDYSSSDDDSYEDIDYVEASPPNSELVSLEEVVEIVISEVGGIDTDILLTIKEDILREKLLNSSSTSLNFFLEETNTFDNSLPESETFCFNLEEISSGSPTSYLDLSLPDYEAFFCDSEPDSGNFTMDVVEDIFDNPTREPRVHVPNVLPTHPTLHLDSDFTLSSDSLGSDLAVSFPSGTRNKIFDPGIFIEVQSKRFLSPNEFSISFIRDPLSPVFDTLLPFSSENENNVFNPGILASNEEKSPHLLSHRGL